MTEFSTRSLRCPVCNTEFCVDVPQPAQRTGRDTDFRPRFDGPDPLPTAVDSCPTCRFSAYPVTFGWRPEEEADDDDRLSWAGRPPPSLGTLEDDALDDLRVLVRRTEFTAGLALAGGVALGGERWVLAARCYENVREQDNLGIADHWLKASWCARAQQAARLEAWTQREAIARIQVALDENQIAEGERPRATYLLAELSRRRGDFSRAVDLYGRVGEIADPDDADGQLLRNLARRQVALATVKSAINAVIHDETSSETDEDETA